ncbi:MAG: hypothetical protein GY803_25290 [Chloroflexi bacterium]|nr:hypothetical protein [Chloroflexota bacterium]
MAKQDIPKDLSRVDHIREESKRALEYGQSPRRPISLAQNFRVEGIMPVPMSPTSTIAPSFEEAFKNDFDFKGSIPRAENSHVRLASTDALCTAIEANLERLDPKNRGELVPQILALFGDVASQIQDVKRFESLHKRVLIAAFGEGYFKNMGGREGSRAPRK